LDGTLAEGPGVIGLHLVSNDNVIDGLTIRNFSGNGIRIAGKDNIVKRCLIGHSDGIAAPNGAFGIEVVGENNIIGPGNVISGNASSGIRVMSAAGCRIFGNVIGLDIGATFAIPNGAQGILVSMATKVVIGGEDEGNVISGNVTEGIKVTDVSTGELEIGGNIIGAARAPKRKTPSAGPVPAKAILFPDAHAVSGYTAATRTTTWWSATKSARTLPAPSPFPTGPTVFFFGMAPRITGSAARTPENATLSPEIRLGGG